jgi:DNA-binding transcriptional MerR regulator
MKERFPFEKKNIMEMPCEGCGELGHSFENCPKLTEEQREEIRRKLREKRQMIEKNIEKDIEDILKEKEEIKNKDISNKGE